MVRNRIFWDIEEHLYFVYYPIIYYQRIKVYRVENGYGMNPLEQWFQWDGSAGKMVSVENKILVSTMVIIVQDKILW